MKKISFTTIITLSAITSTKSQSTMIVHGTDATMFYTIINGVSNKITADELWWGNNANGTGIYNSINLNYIVDLPNIEPLDPPIIVPENGLQKACGTAKHEFGSSKVQCGPRIGPTNCQNMSGSYACSIKMRMSNGADWIFYGDNGDYSYWGF